MFETFVTDLKTDILSAVERYLEQKQDQRPRVLGLISLEDLKDELSISYQTVVRWERAGLKRYLPPLEDTRTVFYKVADVLTFLGVDNER